VTKKPFIIAQKYHYEQAVASRTRNNNDYRLFIQDLKPDCLVVRPVRLVVLSSDAWIKEHYEIVKVYDVIDQLV